MCLAIYKPFGQKIDEEKLFYGFDNNDDGAGFIVSNGEKAIGMKGFFTFDGFMDRYKEYNNGQFATAVHFRMATHGGKTKENCHPFRLTDKYLAIHNGILPWKSCDDHSDTYYFCKEVLRPLCKSGHIETEKTKELLEAYIDYNKIVIVRSDGTPIIINESCGAWKDDIWYSNTSYEDNYYRAACGYYNYSGYNDDHDYYDSDKKFSYNSSKLLSQPESTHAEVNEQIKEMEKKKPFSVTVASKPSTVSHGLALENSRSSTDIRGGWEMD